MVIRGCVGACGALTMLVILAIAGIVARIAWSPIDLSFLSTELRAGIAGVLGPGATAKFSAVELAWFEGNLRLAVNDLTLTRADGSPIGFAPRAFLGIDLVPLMLGRVEPVSLIVHEPALSLTVDPKGDLSLGGPDPVAGGGRPAPAFSLLDPELLGRVFGARTPIESGGSIARLGLRNVTITLLDQRSGLVRRFERFDIDFTREGEGAFVATLASNGVHRPWTARLEAGHLDEKGRPIHLTLDHVALDDVAGSEIGPIGAMTLGGDFAGTVPVDGSLPIFTGHVALGGDATVKGPGWNAQVRSMAVAFTIDAAHRRIDIAPSKVAFGGVGGQLSGSLGLPAAGDPTKPVRLDLALDDLVLDHDGKSVPEIKRLTLTGAFEIANRTLWVERATASGATPIAQAEGALVFVGDTPAIKLQANAHGIPVATARQIWPPFIAKEAYDWFMGNVDDGRLDDVRLDLDVPPGVLDGRPLERDWFHAEWRVSAGVVHLAPDIPPVRDVSGVIYTNGISARVEARDGHIEVAGGVVTLPTITFVADDMHLKQTLGRLDATATGPAGALLDLSERQGVPIAKGGGVDVKALAGEGSATIQVRIPLFPPARAAEAGVVIDAELRNVAGKGLIEGRDLEKGLFRIHTEGAGYTVEGVAVVGGLPLRLSVRQEATGAKRLIFRAEADTDDASRAKLGFDFANVISGPVTVKLLREQVPGGDATRRVEADLTQARITLPQIMFEKAKGVPATISAALKGQTRVTGFDDVKFEGRGFSVKGRVRLGDDGLPSVVDLSDVRLRPDEQVAAKVEREPGHISVHVTGKFVDARPYIQRVLADEDNPDAQGRFDLSVRVDRALGQNGIALNDLRLDMSKDGPRLVDCTIGGSFGGATRITGEILTDQGRPYLRVISTDAGSALRFFDLYRNVRGGRLTLTQTLTDTRRSDGVIFMEGFHVVNDEGLQRLFGAAPPAEVEGGETRRLPARTDDVTFERLHVRFSRAPGGTQFEDGVLRNLSVGMTFDGRIDWRRKTVDVRGTFIPMFAINNLLARVPVLSAILGGQNEGLIGITFAASGPLSNPAFRINPASAIAPGFLRNLFAFPGAPDDSEAR